MFLQLGASDEMTLNQDECPGHPSYHPPGSGGLSGLLRMRYDAAMWKTHRWVHTSASKWHEYAPKMLFFLEASLWLAMMFQLSYFPLRAQFPVLLNAWKSFSAKFVTFNISSMGGFDPFKPAYSTTVILVMSMIFVVTIQV